jgi:poly-gamma-glutamate synthesis protein (capsule biosynthesis protein)
MGFQTMRRDVMDWEKGVWSRGDSLVPEHRVVVAGDWYPQGPLLERTISEPTSLYNDLLPILRDADLRVVNLEAPLSDRGSPIPKDGPNHRLPPAAIAGLSVVPIDLACLANNHILDFGPEALRDSLDQLGERGIDTVGAGMSPEDAWRPAIRTISGLTVGIVNFSEGEDGTAAVYGPGVCGWEPDRIVRAVASAKERCDLVIAIGHGGREYVPAPPPYFHRLCRSVAESGADFVVGHHPHVPQGAEIHAGVPIVYSLGNFVLRMRGGSVFRRRGLLLSIGIRDRRVAGFELIPFSISSDGLETLPDREQRWLLEQLRQASEILADPLRVREVWHAFLDRFEPGWWRRPMPGISSEPSLRGLLGSLRRPGARDSRRRRKAIKIRNRFVTPAHHHFLSDGLARMSSGTLGDAPPWAQELVASWLELDESGLEDLLA